MTAEPTSKRGHGLELIQTNFASQKKMFEDDGQNATKITSALADLLIQHFSLSVSPFCFSQRCDHVIIKTDSCSQTEQMDTES